MTNQRQLIAAHWTHSLKLSVVFAVLLTLPVLSLTGCTSQPTKQPATIKEFLSQPRPK